MFGVYSETLQQIEAQKRWMAVTDDQRQNEKRNDTAGSGRCRKQKKKHLWYRKQEKIESILRTKIKK